MFVPTIVLTNEIIERIEKGEIRLRCGQWVQIPHCTKRSRFVCLSKGKSLWIVHYGGRSPMVKFNTLCKRRKQ